MGNAHIVLSWLLSLIVSGNNFRFPAEYNQTRLTSAKTKLTTFGVETSIQFRYARTSVHLEAFNPSTNPQQFPFSLILPEAAFVMNMSLTYDGKEHVARVEEKNVAQKQFLDAVNEGRTAAQVMGTVRDAQKVAVNVNIEPKETVVLVVTYEELLKRKVGRYEYSANINPGSVVDNFTVTVHLNESLPIKNLLVPDISDNTNDIGPFEITGNGQPDVENLGDSSAIITYKPTRLDQERFGSEGIASKFIVEYDVERDNQDSIVQVMDGYFVHFFAPNNQKPLPKHIIFVLDTSGSMQGIKMDQMKNAMVEILEQVTSKDYLSIISFSDMTNVWRSNNQGATNGQYNVPRPLQAIEYVKNEANDYIMQLEANGNTNINTALLEAVKVAKNLKKGGGQNATPIIFFLTDGEATVGETTSQIITRNVVNSNIGEEVNVPIFSLAFGSDADFNLLKDISLNNLGFSKKIYEGADADLQVEGFYQTIADPLLKNVKFEYVGDMWERSSLSDGNTPTFFMGTEEIVVGKLNEVYASNHSNSGITVAGEGINGNKYEDLIELGDITDVTTESGVNFLERLWAFKTIKRLLAIASLQTGISNRSQVKDQRKQALDLSLRYNFVTELTSLIVTKPGEEEDEVNPVPVATKTENSYKSSTTRTQDYDYDYYYGNDDYNDYYGNHVTNFFLPVIAGGRVVDSGNIVAGHRTSLNARTTINLLCGSGSKPCLIPTTKVPGVDQQNTGSVQTKWTTTTVDPMLVTSNVTSCNITMFSHGNSKGDKVTFSKDQDNIGTMDNNVWSIRIDGNCCWRIFTETNFQGKYKDFCTATYNNYVIFKDASSVKLIH